MSVFRFTFDWFHSILKVLAISWAFYPPFSKGLSLFNYLKYTWLVRRHFWFYFWLISRQFWKNRQFQNTRDWFHHFGIFIAYTDYRRSILQSVVYPAFLRSFLKGLVCYYLEEHSILVYNNGGVSTIGVSHTLWVIQLSRFYNLIGVHHRVFWIFLGHTTIEVLMFMHYPTSWEMFTKGLRFYNNGKQTMVVCEP